MNFMNGLRWFEHIKISSFHGRTSPWTGEGNGRQAFGIEKPQIDVANGEAAKLTGKRHGMPLPNLAGTCGKGEASNLFKSGIFTHFWSINLTTTGYRLSF